MLIIKPDFYDKFVCIAEKCPLTCCQEWKIAVDDATERKWKKLAPPDAAKAGRENLSLFTTCKDGMRVIALEKDHRCPFLNEEKLCKLVLAYGDEVLSETCAVFPREIHDFGSRREYSLMPCCPAVIDLLNVQKDFRFMEQESAREAAGEKLRGTGMEQQLFQIRDFFCNIMETKDRSPETSLLMIFYLALDFLEVKENGRALEAKQRAYRGQGALRELEQAIADITPEPLFTFEERNELFLDLAVNYRKEGLYRSYLEKAAQAAERYSEGYEDEALAKQLQEFQNEMESYEDLFRNFLRCEIYSDCLLPEGNLEEMVVKLQWLAMEYAVICHVIFLNWQQEGKLTYEGIRDTMVVICRMTGYEEEDIFEYLENSFERLVWDWGYFALVVGT